MIRDGMVKVDEDLLAFYLDWVDGDGLRRRQAQCLTGTQIEAGAVQVTFDGVVVDVAVTQGDVAVAASITDGEIFALVQHDGQVMLINGERPVGS